MSAQDHPLSCMGGGSGSRARWARGRRSPSRCPFGLTKGVRAIRAEASPHGHDVSPVPAREPRRARSSARSAAPASRSRVRQVRRPNCRRARKFCPECAHADRARRRAARGSRFGSPESYTPKHLAEKILTSKAALEGERKQVTVLFADLKGSMELLADRDPEEARKLLDPVLERMMEAVHRYEGTVNQVMGDGIMALFGAPLAHEDHAVRACYAALAHAGGGRRGTPRRCGARTGVDVQIRVGPQLRRGGGARHRQRPAHGLHGGRPDHAPGGAHGAARQPGHDPADRRDPAAGRGLRRGQAARAGAGQGAGRAGGGLRAGRAPAPCARGSQAAAARGLTRFVGRDGRAGAAPPGARAGRRPGHGQVVAVVGEPGVGKSRLV